MFSMRDLRETKSRQLQRFLSGQVRRLAEHIKFKRVTCSARGFVCEICSDDKPIYAFENIESIGLPGAAKRFSTASVLSKQLNVLGADVYENVTRRVKS